MADEHWHPFLLHRTPRQVDLLRRGRGSVILHCYGWVLLDKQVMGVLYENHIGRQTKPTYDPIAVIMDLFCEEPDRTKWENYFLEIAQKRLLEAASLGREHVYNPTTGCCNNCEESWAAIEQGKISRRCPGEPLPF